MSRVMMTAATVAMMCMVFAAYARFTRPMLQSEVTRQANPIPPAPPVPKELTEIASGLLKWDDEPDYSVSRDNGLTRLLFDTWKRDPVDPGLVELRPFAFIATDPERPDEPYVIRSDVARIHFDEFDPFKRRFGRLIRGTLGENVQITGPDGMAIEGRDFYVTEDELYSDSPIQFAFGPSNESNKDFLRVTGSAGKITVQFKKARIGEPGLLGKTLPPWIGFESIRLRSNVQMEIVSDQSRPGDRKKPDHLTIACRESCRYFVDRREAVFEQDVRVVHSNSYGGSGLNLTDKLHELSSCERLTLQLDNVDRDAPQIANFDLALAVRSIEAHAAAAAGQFRRVGSARPNDVDNPRAQLRLDSYDDSLTALCGKLRYDLLTRKVVLSTADAALNALAPFVSVRMSEQELFCPVVRIQTDEDNELVKASFPGPGALRTRPTLDATGRQELPALQANWSEVVEIDPVISDLGEKQMRLAARGDVVLKMPAEQTRVTAPELVAWLDESSLPSDAGGGSEIQQAVGVEPRPNPLRRVLADHGAHITRPDLDFDARKTFEMLVLPVNEVTNPLRQTSSESRSDAQASDAAEPERDPPIRGEAETVSVAVGIRDRDAELLGMTAEKGVWLEQAGENADSPPRIHVSGDRASLTGRGLAQELTLIGNTARLAADGISLEASRLTANRATGVISVPGRGQLTIPMSADISSSLGNNNRDSATDGGLETVTIRWEERVEFEGQTVRFFGNVVADQGEAGTIKVHCQELDARLSRPLNLSGLTPATVRGLRNESPELETLTFRHRVQINSEEWTGTELTSLRTVSLAELSYNRVTEQIHGVGPGVIRQWTLNKPDKDEQASPGQAPRQNYRLSRVSFVGELHGNADRRWLRISRDVKALTGVVDRALVDLSRDDLLDRPGQPLDAVWIGCDTLEVAIDQTTRTEAATSPEGEDESSSNSSAIDLERLQVQATGHVELEGQQFRAIADTASVNRSTGMISIHSAGGKDAAIWQQATPDSPPTTSRARAFRINPEKRTFEADEAAGIWGGR